MSSDQAKGLRDLVKKNKGESVEKKSTIFLSVREGMGSTTILSNISNIMSKDDRKILLIDFNSDILTTDVLLNVLPRHNLEKLVDLECDDKEMLIKIRENIYGIYANRILEADDSKKSNFREKVSRIMEKFDQVFIDICGLEKLGILDSMLESSNILVTTNPSSEGIQSAYYGIKYLNQNIGIEDIGVLINKSKERENSEKLFCNLENTISQFLKIKVENYGYIGKCDEIMNSAKNQSLFTDIYPDALCTKEIKDLINKIIN